MNKPHTTSRPNQQPTPAAHWPTPPTPPVGSPNIILMMLDDVGFADFGCYGSEIDTPTIDAVANAGVRYSGFHTTAMCSTTVSYTHLTLPTICSV